MLAYSFCEYHLIRYFRLSSQDTQSVCLFILIFLQRKIHIQEYFASFEYFSPRLEPIGEINNTWLA